MGCLRVALLRVVVLAGSVVYGRGTGEEREYDDAAPVGVLCVSPSPRPDRDADPWGELR